jgi:hypothetical protein
MINQPWNTLIKQFPSASSLFLFFSFFSLIHLHPSINSSHSINNMSADKGYYPTTAPPQYPQQAAGYPPQQPTYGAPDYPPGSSPYGQPGYPPHQGYPQQPGYPPHQGYPTSPAPQGYYAQGKSLLFFCPAGLLTPYIHTLPLQPASSWRFFYPFFVHLPSFFFLLVVWNWE